jgi:hypothetical protein
MASEHESRSRKPSEISTKTGHSMILSNGIAWTLMVILFFFAVLHLYWGFGGFWPARNEQELVGLVIGKTEDMRMPSLWECVTVSLLMIAGMSVLFLRHAEFWDWFPGWMLVAAHFIMTCAFLARGCVTYFTSLTHYAIGTPFYGLDRLYYAPFCLGIGCLLIIEAATKAR